MVWKEKGDVEVLGGGCNDAVHEGECVDDGKEMCLDLTDVVRAYFHAIASRERCTVIHRERIMKKERAGS